MSLTVMQCISHVHTGHRDYFIINTLEMYHLIILQLADQETKHLLYTSDLKGNVFYFLCLSRVENVPSASTVFPQMSEYVRTPQKEINDVSI